MNSLLENAQEIVKGCGTTSCINGTRNLHKTMFIPDKILTCDDLTPCSMRIRKQKRHLKSLVDLYDFLGFTTAGTQIDREIIKRQIAEVIKYYKDEGVSLE